MKVYNPMYNTDASVPKESDGWYILIVIGWIVVATELFSCFGSLMDKLAKNIVSSSTNDTQLPLSQWMTNHKQGRKTRKTVELCSHMWQMIVNEATE